jgi:glutamyl-tRNA synthetase
MKVRSKKLTELAENSEYFFIDPSQYEEKAARKNFNSEAVKILNDLVPRIENCHEFTHDKVELIYKEYSEKNSVQVGKLIHPTRLAISGVSFGPGLFEMMVLLGKETVIRRMQKAIGFINTNLSH